MPTEEEMAFFHQWCRSFDAISRQVPAPEPYSALDVAHWIERERQIRLQPGQRVDHLEHDREAARRRRMQILETRASA